MEITYLIMLTKQFYVKQQQQFLQSFIKFLHKVYTVLQHFYKVFYNNFSTVKQQFLVTVWFNCARELGILHKSYP